MAKAPKQLPRWRVTMLRKRAQELGEVNAADEDGAIREAARAFEVRDVDIPRLAVRGSDDVGHQKLSGVRRHGLGLREPSPAPIRGFQHTR
jgi:hypothetical protein